MQSDEVIWQIINHQFCSFKAKIARERTFCQNIYNVTGLCLRSACPLANSSYATIREIDGVCYLFIKTAERAHTPKKLWEKIRLPGNYTKALEIVSQQLEHFPKYLIHRNKQRLTKIHQMLIRMRKLQLKEGKPKIVTTSTRTDHREIIREKKALKAAQLDRAIENELLERLRQVSENEIYNYPEKQYTKALNRASDKIQDDEEEFEEEEVEEDSSLMMRQTNKRITASGLSSKDLKDEDDDEDEDDLEDGQWGNDINSDEDIDPMDGNLDVEYVEDFEESDEEDDIEDIYSSKTSQTSARSKKSVSFKVDPKAASKRKAASLATTNSKKKSARVEIEYEEEENESRERVSIYNN